MDHKDCCQRDAGPAAGCSCNETQREPPAGGDGRTLHLRPSIGGGLVSSTPRRLANAPVRPALAGSPTPSGSIAMSSPLAAHHVGPPVWQVQPPATAASSSNQAISARYG